MEIQFKWGIAAIIALAHDVLITLGAFAITGREFTLPVLAAVSQLLVFQ